MVDIAHPVQDIQKKVKEETVSKPVSDYRSLIFQIYLTAATAAFTALAVLSHFASYFSIDLILTQAIQQFHIEWFVLLMQTLSIVGNFLPGAILAGLICLFIYLIGFKWEAVSTLFSVAGAYMISSVLKIIVNRPRPSIDLIDVFSPMSSASFPSGHVLYYVSLFGFIIFLLFTLMKQSLLKSFLISILLIIIILIAPSRMYLGYHWASDTLGSYLVGSIWLTICVYIYRWGKSRFFLKQPAAPDTK